jgi:hypothetical protein
MYLHLCILPGFPGKSQIHDRSPLFALGSRVEAEKSIPIAFLPLCFVASLVEARSRRARSLRRFRLLSIMDVNRLRRPAELFNLGQDPDAGTFREPVPMPTAPAGGAAKPGGVRTLASGNSGETTSALAGTAGTSHIDHQAD